MAKAVAVEARASHNTFAKEGIYDDHTCLSLFAPVINIMRHPLWGRNQVCAILVNEYCHNTKYLLAKIFKFIILAMTL